MANQLVYIGNMKNTTADYLKSKLGPLVPTGSPILSISCINDRAYYFYANGLEIPPDFYRFAYFGKALLVKSYQLNSFVEALEALENEQV